MSATAEDLLSLLKAGTANGLTGEGPVWRLDGVDRGAEALRESFLATAARFPTVYVHYDGERPDEPTLQGTTSVVPNVWLLPAGASGKDLSSWLYMGNWQLYARREPLRELRDLCRTEDAGVSRFVRDSAVTFIIDSFHDDTHWTIGLQVESK